MSRPLIEKVQGRSRKCRLPVITGPSTTSTQRFARFVFDAVQIECG